MTPGYFGSGNEVLWWMGLGQCVSPDIYWAGQCGEWLVVGVEGRTCGCRLAGVGVGVVRGLGWHIEMFLACRGGRVGWSANL